MRVGDLKIHDGLSIVKLDGYETAKEGEEGYECGGIDLPGSANWLCEQYGMSDDDFEGSGILFSDYDGWRGGPWDFSLLIASENVGVLADFACEAGYHVEGIEPIAEPTNFGDGGGTVEILRHRDGWILMRS